jgi:hypothetical protein
MGRRKSIPRNTLSTSEATNRAVSFFARSTALFSTEEVRIPPIAKPAMRKAARLRRENLCSKLNLFTYFSIHSFFVFRSPSRETPVPGRIKHPCFLFIVPH